MEKNVISRVLFIGSKAFGLQTLKLIYTLTPQLIKAVITYDDHLDARSKKNEFEHFSKQNDIPLFISNEKTTTHSLVKEIDPDLCFVNGWYRLFNEETLAIPPCGFIGIHHSLLPKYRGGSPLVWQILNNELELGSSLFYLDKDADSGDIIFQLKIKNEEFYISEARERLEQLMLNKLKNNWNSIINNTNPRTPQNQEDIVYCSQLTEEDGQIDWNKSAKEIACKIRAQSLPYPCAYTFYNNIKVKIVTAKIFPKIFYGIPGQIVAFDNETGNPIVACGGKDALIIEKLYTDKLIVDSKQILSSISIRLK